MIRSASYYFRFVFFLGGIFLAVFLIVLWNAMPFAAVGAHAFLGHIGDFCERLSKTNKLALYGITFGFFILTAMLAHAFGRMILSSLNTSFAFARSGARSRQEFNKKILKAIKRAGLKKSDLKIINNGQTSFCAGFLRPKILISQNFFKKINIQELSAVLLHEKQHLASFDILKTFAARFFSSLFFFIPAFKILAQKYYLASELEADARASGGFRYRAPLLSAIGKICKEQHLLSQAPGVATALNARMGFLLSLDDFPKIRISKKQLMQSLVLCVAAVFVFLLSFHFNHALSVEVLKYRDGQMTPLAWNNVSFFDASNLYLTPINQTLNAVQCSGQPANFSHL